MDEVERMMVGFGVAKRQDPGFDVEAALHLLRGTVPDPDLVWAVSHGLGLAEDCILDTGAPIPSAERLQKTREALRRAGFAV
jgi:hypothetical protein